MFYMAHNKEKERKKNKTTPRIIKVMILGKEEDFMSTFKLLDSETRFVPGINVYFCLLLEEVGCPAQ